MSLRQFLADDWRKLVRLWSVQLHFVAMTIAALYAVMPVLDPTIYAALPAPLQMKAVGLYAFGGLLVRVIRQKNSGG